MERSVNDLVNTNQVIHCVIILITMCTIYLN